MATSLRCLCAPRFPVNGGVSHFFSLVLWVDRFYTLYFVRILERLAVLGKTGVAEERTPSAVLHIEIRILEFIALLFSIQFV